MMQNNAMRTAEIGPLFGGRSKTRRERSRRPTNHAASLRLIAYGRPAERHRMRNC